MDRPEKARPAPRIIRVPPPEGDAASNREIQVLALTILAATLLVAVALGSGVAAIVILLIALGVTGLLIWLPRSANKSFRRKRAEFLAKLADLEPDPLAAAVAAKWTRPSKVPKPGDICAALRASQDPETKRACIVCLGMVDVPEVDDALFEPEIITPTRALGRRLFFVPAALAIIALWFLQILGIIPGKMTYVGGFGYLIVMGVSVGVLWFWRSAIRPTYIRMAPGIIQVLEYHYGRGKPSIRSYPLEGGTLVVVRGQTTSPKPGHITLTLLRDEQKDTLELWRMRQRNAIVQRTWQTLLSTAPTPPLSDEDLVG